MRAKVYKSTGSWYSIKLEDGNFVKARIRGKIRLQKLKSTNPVAVGDDVLVELDKMGEYQIYEVLNRKNYIIRRSNNLSKQTQIIASNLDRAIIIATLVSPKTSPGFIDRFLFTTEMYHINPLIIFNKTDLLSSEGMEFLESFANIYHKAGYRTMNISALNENDVEKVKKEISSGTSLVFGHSGVGKSTLLNALSPNIHQQTAALSLAWDKGVHTTTFAQMFEPWEDAFVIDTPGVRDFGIVDVSLAEAGHYFPEIKRLMKDCKYNNCVHLNEPGCAVMAAVQNEQLAESRYLSYLSISSDLK